MYEQEISELEEQYNTLKQKLSEDGVDILAVKEQLAKLEKALAETHQKHKDWLEQDAKLKQYYEEEQKKIQDKLKNLNKPEKKDNTYWYIGLGLVGLYLLTR